MSSYGDSRRHDHDSGRSGGRKDDPPNSRLFIMCGKQITEEQFRESFGPYGTIEEVWIVKDKVTREPKGVTYIKFSKTSEAALAMEEMNGKVIEGSPRSLKVLIAHSRDQGSRRDNNEDERLVRLFVIVGKTTSEAEIKDHFAQFGDIDYVSVVKDRETKESKGFAYVKYHRMSHAAKAFEECDRTFKPVFAEPKPNRPSYNDYGSARDRYGGPRSTGSGSTVASISGSYDMLSHIDTTHSNPDGICCLSVVSSSYVNQDQIWRLFDLVPGLDFCEISRSTRMRNDQAIFTVVYNNPQSAGYAKEKLHGFEYPPGCRLIVQFDTSSAGGYRHRSHSSGQPQMAPPSSGGKPGLQNDLAHLTKTIANATALLHAAGYATPGGGSSQSESGETYDPAYCSVKLPAPEPLASIDSVVEQRLFIVCTPVPPELHVLKDVFGRFGNLVDVYILMGKTCGYVKYSSKESAEKAMATLHGQEVCRSRLKVMPAEDKPGDSSRKRQKMDSE